MITRKIIDQAILAHGKWKTSLYEFINGKKPGFDLSKAGTDSDCDFGKWIYGGTIDENDKKSEYYQKALELHADFHQAVKEIAELVIAGKSTEAKPMITNIKGSYSQISTRLTLTLLEWEKTL